MLRRRIHHPGIAAGIFGLLALVACFVLPGLRVVEAQPSQERQRSLAAWNRINPVLQHPRCMNCHQLVTPLQGDERRSHMPLVVRGPDNHGVGAMRCQNCHNASIGNNLTSGAPGAGTPGLWQLAPVSMLWQGLSSGDLCQMLKDPTRNGKRDGEKLIEHMESEPLVLWGWNPGPTRQAIPLPHDEFVDAMKVWVAGGMACPK